MVFYLLTALAYLALAAVDHEAGSAALPVVIAVALPPAIYAELLRVFRRADDA